MKKKSSIITVVCLCVALFTLGTQKLHAAPVNLVDLNKASLEELMSLPGIGESKAEAIMDYRSAHPFASAAEITNVKGIGNKLYERISQYVAVEGKAGSTPTKTGTAGK